MENSYLSRTFSGSPTMTTFTVSFWMKRSAISATQRLISARVDGNNESTFFISSADKFYVSQTVGGATKCDIHTNRVFRDPSAWYNIVVQKNTTLATANDRVKIWVNGVEETDLTRSTAQVQNEEDFFLKSTATNEIGRRPSNNDQHFDGYLSHFSVVQGSVVAPTSFGETDSTSGIWKFKSPSGVTWGTNGFHLKFENAGAIGTDSSGNSQTWTGGGNLKQALDTPSNVYATLNAIQESPANNSLSNGNTTSTNDGSASGHKLRVATLGASSGKWYMEAKLPNGGSDYAWCGIISYDDFNNPDTYMGSSQNSISYGNGGTVIRNDSVLSATGTVPTIGGSTILQVALDLDNNFVYFGIDGTYVNSGNPTSGGSGTGGYSINFSAGKTYTFGVSGQNTGASWNCNFGNGFFGTTAITSAGSNGNGSLFEYDVPSGYYALNTKNINTYG